MKILVIGSEGFVGKYMVKALMAQGHRVVGLDVAPEDGGRSGYAFFTGNICNAPDIERAAMGVDMVINLAAKHHDFGISREEFFQINEAGTQVMLDVLARLNIDKLVFFSSVAVYGERPEESHEQMAPAPSNNYGESKKAGEDLIFRWAKEKASREALIVRPVVIFGPHNYANMFRLIDTIYRGRFFMIGRGDNIKSVAYVENVVDATLFMAGRMHPGVEIINYSDAPQRTSLEIANIIRQECGKGPLRFTFPLGLAVALASPFDLLAKIVKRNIPITANRIKKFNASTRHGSAKVRALGYVQRVSTDEGLRRMVQWYLKEGRHSRERCASGPRG